MKRKQIVLIAGLLAGSLCLALMPGCDELVTKESYDSTIVYIYQDYTDSNCIKFCHNPENTEIDLAMASQPLSAHAENSNYDGVILSSNASVCGPQCHSKEGFLESVSSYNFSTNRLPLDCEACHIYHDPFLYPLPDTILDTTNVRGDLNLRLDSLDMITLHDSTLGVEVNNNAKLCMFCHQSTQSHDNLVAIDVSVNEAWITWANHSSNSSDNLLRIGGHYHPGYTDYLDSSGHDAIGDGCLTCHMNETAANQLGGHSFNIIYDSEFNNSSCVNVGCHTFNYNISLSNFFKGNVADSLNILKDILAQLNLLDPVTFEPVEQNINDIEWAGALYNYFYVLNDPSGGIHNYYYSRALVRNSILYLQSIMP